MLGASLNYQILDWLNVSGRVRLDNSNNDYTEKAYASTNTQLTEFVRSWSLWHFQKLRKQFVCRLPGKCEQNNSVKKWSLQANMG